MCKRAINNADRKLFSLPIKIGDMGLPILPEVASHETSNSTAVTGPLVKSILKEIKENDAEIEV